MIKNKLVVLVAAAVVVLASCAEPSIPSTSLSSSSQPSSSVASSISSTSSSTSSSVSSSSTVSSSSASSSASSSVSSSSTQPLIPVLATIKGTFENLVVSTFIKSGTNRVYVVRLSNPAVAPNPPVIVSKLVITNTTAILFEKDLTPANSSAPSFSGASLFDDNTLMLNYFSNTTQVRSMSLFNLTTRLETPIGAVRLVVIPNANASQTLVKNRTFFLQGSIGTEHGIFRLNNDLTTTLIRAIPQEYINNFNFNITSAYNYPFIVGFGDNAVRGMNYVAPTKSYSLVLKLADFSLVMEAERNNEYPSLGTMLQVNFFTNAISIRKTVTSTDPNNVNNIVFENTLYVYAIDGTEKINQIYRSELIAFSVNQSAYLTQNNMSNTFFPGPITGLTFGRRTPNANGSFDFFMYDATLTQTRTFTVGSTTESNINIDQFGNVYVLTQFNPTTFTVYATNGTDYVYTPDAKFDSFNFRGYHYDYLFYDLPLSRTRNPILLELLNDGTMNVIIFINNSFRVSNVSNIGDITNVNHFSTRLFENNIQYISFTGYSYQTMTQIFRSIILNLSANTLTVVPKTYSGSTMYSQNNYAYSNGYVVDTILDNINSQTNTVGVEFVNITTGTHTYVAFTTPFVGFIYIDTFTLNNDGTFTMRFSGGSNQGIISGTTADLTTLTVTASSGGGGGGSFSRVFENILNDLDFAFVESFTPGNQNTPPTNTRAYYLGTNYNGQVSSLTQVTGASIPTTSLPFQIITMDETGTANDKLFIYFNSTNTLVDLTTDGFPTLKGYFTTTGFTLIDANFNEIDDYIVSSNISIINPFGVF